MYIIRYTLDTVYKNILDINTLKNNLLKNKKIQAWQRLPLFPAGGRQRQVGLWLKGQPVYVVSYKSARVTQWDIFSFKKRQEGIYYSVRLWSISNRHNKSCCYLIWAHMQCHTESVSGWLYVTVLFNCYRRKACCLLFFILEHNLFIVIYIS